jgi:transcriptional regulator of arginine metabolism
MAKVQPINSVSARRSAAIAAIKTGRIHSQEDLVQALKKGGFAVTQATASRDIEEIGAVRIRNSAGEMVYSIGESTDASFARSMPLPHELIISVESSGNLAVVRTPPGGAQLLASSLDHSGIKEIIGTIAGDDTVLVVSRSATGGGALARELLLFAGKPRVKKSTPTTKKRR